MSLPILSHHPQPTTDDLIRFFYRTELQWARQLAEEEQTLDVGTALFNPALPLVFDANMIFDAAIPEGGTAETAMAEADTFFAERRGRVRMWVMNPSAPKQRTSPLVERIEAAGYKKGGYDILRMGTTPAGPIEEVAGLTIIPARASFRHCRELSTIASTEWGEAQLGDAQMIHLEDPGTDARLALKEGRPVALVTVQAVGEIGCIENLFVVKDLRGQGIGTTMMSRALEICARSLFKHVFVGVTPTNDPAVKLYTHLGFQRIGAFVYFATPREEK